MNIASVVYVHALVVFIFLGCLVEEKNKYKTMLVSLKTVINSCVGLVRKPHHDFCAGLPLCHWLIFSCVHRSLDAGKIQVGLIELVGNFIEASRS